MGDAGSGRAPDEIQDKGDVLFHSGEGGFGVVEAEGGEKGPAFLGRK
jgi:hypothetical protein